jgi:crotonobetainyl-CoA:carnitine CoA-transferase CaiB-like acyl-CoA transferase
MTLLGDSEAPAPIPASAEARADACASGPLAGVRVLDFSHFIAGPYATMILAELGADVIKLEDPDRPDTTRGIGPYFIENQSLYFASLNWSKRSLSVRLSHPDGLQTVRELISKTDVVVDNFRVGVMAKLGLDRDVVRTVNPRAISVAITGFGADGPYADRPAYDYTIQALAGVMSMTGEPGGVPTKAGIPYVDHSGGLAAALAITSAVVERNRTGHGRHVDVALLDVQISMLSYLAAWQLNAGYDSERLANSAHASLVPAQNFATADGFISIFVGNDAMWLRMVSALGNDSIVADPKYLKVAARSSDRVPLLRRIQEILSTQSTADWVEKLAACHVSSAPVNQLSEALADPHVAARNLIVSAGSGGRGILHVRGPLPDLAGHPGVRPAPNLGQHTVETLTELGYTAQRIEALVSDGALQVASDLIPRGGPGWVCPNFS